MRTGNLRLVTVLALLLGGILMSVTVGRGTAQFVSELAATVSVEPPEFAIRRGPSSLSITATTASAAQEKSLLRIARENYADTDLTADFRAGVILPRRWEVAGIRLLDALEPTLSATADMDGEKIRIRAVTDEPEALDSGLDRLRASVSPDVAIDQDVVIVGNSASVDDLCHRNLSHTTSEPVRFRQSSSKIHSSSRAVLDRIVEVLNDCRDSAIAISGHSDASGDETWNRRLSLARAQAVADYLARAGIDPNRLQTFGLGSSMPIADNSTASGRSQNRRIEFELRSR